MALLGSARALPTAAPTIPATTPATITAPAAAAGLAAAAADAGARPPFRIPLTSTAASTTAGWQGAPGSGHRDGALTGQGREKVTCWRHIESPQLHNCGGWGIGMRVRQITDPQTLGNGGKFKVLRSSSALSCEVEV